MTLKGVLYRVEPTKTLELQTSTHNQTIPALRSLVGSFFRREDVGDNHMKADPWWASIECLVFDQVMPCC
jgi:hypothetical protein